MSGVYGEVVLVAGGLWAISCLALIIAWRVSRRGQSSREREVLISVADEFLLVARQAERSVSAQLQSPSAASESSTGAEEFAKYHKRAAVLFDLLHAYLVEDSSALHHAEAIVVDLTGLGGSGSDHRMVEHRSSLAVHRAMFARVIWEDADRATLRRNATRATVPARRGWSPGARRAH
jgi:D-alanine-D-alanine ligase-like ATP-grasp enzyme